MVDDQVDAGRIYKVLSLDGGGIRGVFPAAFLARIEDQIGQPIGRYFDLIVGTSTGGIIAIGLGLGFSDRDILKLYEEQGRAIFEPTADGTGRQPTTPARQQPSC
jgi:patatin-like phospholipase/acyl hydrolase